MKRRKEKKGRTAIKGGRRERRRRRRRREKLPPPLSSPPAPSLPCAVVVVSTLRCQICHYCNPSSLLTVVVFLIARAHALFCSAPSCFSAHAVLKPVLCSAFEFDHVEGQRLYRFVAHLQIPLRQEQRIQMNASIAVPVTNRILHHTIGLPDFTQGLRCFQTVTCYQAVVNNLEDAHEMLDTAISTTLKESKPVYISISCNLAAIPYPTFSREPVPFSLSPKLSNQMGLEAVVEAAADFHGNMSVSKGMKFVGGETAALSRVYEYFWKKI
ncbi:hypothetical protein Ahy_B06g084516 isoform C [Arachis hypogaea]|uniref:pyruvate decarboxylase n=1 Tax=Arachis hypogaea TaxID=3818 RepID=A0A444YS46_ARAHY|nr:hypothetical protein Ahy_B06g084516 isoform C [Arachis hypogaea]